MQPNCRVSPITAGSNCILKREQTYPDGRQKSILPAGLDFPQDRIIQENRNVQNPKVSLKQAKYSE